MNIGMPVPTKGKVEVSVTTGVHDVAGHLLHIPEGLENLGHMAKNVIQIAGMASGASGLITMIDKAFEAIAHAAEGKDEFASVMLASVGLEGVQHSLTHTGPATTAKVNDPSKGPQKQ